MYYKVINDEIVEREDNPFEYTGWIFFDSEEEAVEYFTNPKVKEE